MSTSYLFKGGLIATFDSENKPRTFKADILVENDIIARIDQEITADASVQVVDCTGRWITPGMVDTHRHIWMAVMRGSQGDWLLTEYLIKNSWHEQGDVTVSEVRTGQLAGCLDALNSGVTTILDHFHAANSPEHADAALEATLQSGARVILSMARQSAPTKVLPQMEFGKEADSVKWQWEKLKEWAARDGGKLSPDGRVLLGFAYDQDMFNPDEALIPMHQEALRLARSLPASIITSHVVSGPRILTWRNAGLLGPDVVFSHCNELSTHTALDDEM
ncbi:unnamed protein product [Somion occarium]|uniref:Amidohydrolase-related domain-containing protein n=1 Tax=Somion occarium TaxID=3059160 RepID=A0ABP1D0L8_9APHY